MHMIMAYPKSGLMLINNNGKKCSLFNDQFGIGTLPRKFTTMQRIHAIAAILLIFFAVSSHAVPLSTKSRWIIDDESGERVKLVCGNWEGHTEPMLPEGLNKQPLDDIARHISLMGFNCVRLTYATYMFTRHANLTVAQNFKNLNLTDAIKGISRHNPDLLGLTLVDAQKVVIDALGSNGIMVFLDCQVSQPMWCCNNDDGNGFFGDKYFDPQDWLQTLSIVSQRYKNTPMVMGMSLRNELRGPRQNTTVWYHYVEKGAKLIHKNNPNVLVLISGLDYDLEFGFLKKKPLKLNIRNKTVYETHRYSFTEGQSPLWLNQSVNQMCDNILQEIEDKAGFLMKGENPAPLFVTEFGVDQTVEGVADTYFLSCYLSWLAEKDLDWAIWALQGSYYLRDGLHDPGETFGMFDQTWKNVRSPSFNTKLQLIQQTLQDPFSKEGSYFVLYHPLSGKCGEVYDGRVRAGECWETSKWSYDGEGSPIKLKGTELCLTAIGDGLPVVLTDDCSNELSSWKMALNSHYQLANKDEHGNDLCLDWDPYYSKIVLTKNCIVSQQDDPSYIQLRNPQSQWFKLIQSNAK